MPALRSFQELLDAFVQEVKNRAEKLTDFNEGAINDLLAGASTMAVHEAQQLLVESFKKTFFNTANGPAITGSTDDLEILAVDHYGDEFARPEAQPAIGIVKFSRASTGAGDVLISAGTIVKTEPDANGTVHSYATLIDVTMTGLEINASVEALEGEEGPEGNVAAGEVTVIETSLTDPTITVTNEEDFTGGAAEESDPTYRATIKRKISGLGKATKAALTATALGVSGVVKVSISEKTQVVIEWDIGNSLPVGDYFRIPRVTMYISDANGEASQALINNVKAALLTNRATGVLINVEASEAVELDWSATIVLNGAGPNFAELSQDATPIEETMADYINGLEAGESFDRTLARAAILATWGSAGTGDLTDFTIVTPSGGVTVAENEKLVPGTMEIV